MTSADSKRLDEVMRLAEWCLFAENALAELYRQRGALSDLSKEIFESGLEVIQKTRDRGDLRGMRMVYQDLNEKLGGLGPQMKADLDRRLRAQFGQGLEKEERALEWRARRILKAGRIRNAEEYRTLEARLHVILDDSSNVEEVEQINQVLATVKVPLVD